MADQQTQHNHDTDTVKMKYHRRIDRGPDKKFSLLDGDGKILLSTLRDAFEEAKTRIIRLRDENDGKYVEECLPARTCSC